jgi:hypothetical protein
MGSTPSIPFENSTETYRGGEWSIFRLGTCEGLWRSTFTTYEILAIVNRTPGNGHFREAMLWFEASARRDHKWLKVRECWNLRLAWMLWRNGFRWSPLCDWVKTFDV